MRRAVEMKNGKYFIVAALIIALLGVWSYNATDSKADTGDHEGPAIVEAIEGTDLSRITLTQQASDRLDIQTAEVVEAQVSGGTRLVVPYSSVIYETDGSTWVYTNPEPLVFVRQAITIETIQGEETVLTEGPEAGTKVVSVGGAMLLGTEHGVGH
jgi:hypothetical protein